ERMVLAVPDPVPFLALARQWQVEATVIGWFTGEGRVIVRNGDEVVIDLDANFLHNGRPRLQLQATETKKQRVPRSPKEVVGSVVEPIDALRGLLAHPSLRSNEAVIRTYDHEVLGGTMIRPYDGVALDGPADGTVFIPPGTEGSDPVRAAVIGIGSAILLGRHDCELMAWAAVDEAIRNAVVAGADPDRLSLLDNFAWGNPRNPETLGQLVAACRGCHDAALTYRAPFVSGKDSLFNEFVGPDGTPDPVTPTLIITAVGIVTDIARLPSVGLVRPGNDVWLLGPATGMLGGSYLDEVTGGDRGGHLPAPDPDAVQRHRSMHQVIKAGLALSAHDVSEGGLAAAAAEWAFAGRLGVNLTLAERHTAYELFGEGLARYLIEVDPERSGEFLDLAPTAVRVGWTTDDGRVRIGTELDISLDDIEVAFKSGPGNTLAKRPIPIDPTLPDPVDAVPLAGADEPIAESAVDTGETPAGVGDRAEAPADAHEDPETESRADADADVDADVD
ncbi:MAG: AIR synthase-related protein, partial [Actinomycetota bacterium]